MAKYEASEIMFAASMMYSDDELDAYSKDVSTLKQFMIDARNKIQKFKDKKIYFGSSSIEKGFLDLMDENNKESLKDLVGGISAAKGVKNYLISNGESAVKGTVPSIYMTGDVWPKEVQKFKVNAYGFKDYNSSDIIVSMDSKKFYGVSLKKKRNPTAPEPTLINKAFDTVLQGKEFEGLKKQLAEARQYYFSDLVVEAVKNGLILKSHIKNFDSLKSSSTGTKELFEAKQRDKKLFDRAYIDLKGSAKIKNGYNADETKNPNSMRYFVNKKLAEKDNPLWKQFIEIMNDNADLFADTLINIVLKTKLYDELDAKELNKHKFEFILATGSGDVTGKGDVKVGQAIVVPLKTTLCGLTRIEEQFKNQKYKIVLNNQKKDTSDAAKIFLQLKRGDVTLLDLEIRYKGSFTSQPQFQGTVNSDFKKLLEKECGL